MNLTKEQADQAAATLREISDRLDIDIATRQTLHRVTQGLLTDPRFLTWSGSSQPFQHHYGDYGLVIHTCEVVTTCFSMREHYPQYNIDEIELFLAALFHDAGKTCDYQKVDGVWGSADHKRFIHHISRSAIMWQEAVGKTAHAFQEKYADPVLHAILSHHGQRDWGSPVAPKSRVAWLVFLCDNISARLYDADTMDIVAHRDRPQGKA
jgi:3'-5' exoribonuclease